MHLNVLLLMLFYQLLFQRQFSTTT